MVVVVVVVVVVIVVVVVVVVLTWVVNGKSLSINRYRMRIEVTEHLGVKTPGVPATLHRPDGGGQPWPCACAQGPTNSHNLHNSDVDHLG